MTAFTNDGPQRWILVVQISSVHAPCSGSSLPTHQREANAVRSQFDVRMGIIQFHKSVSIMEGDVIDESKTMEREYSPNPRGIFSLVALLPHIYSSGVHA